MAYQIPTPPLVDGTYSRISTSHAAADAIPLLVDSTYHLFHLTTPSFTRHHPPRLRSSWWRMRSRNLIDWERDEDPSIKPGESIHAPDADGAWTGSAVLGPDGNMNIFYTGYNLLQKGRQVVLRAQSEDPHGRKFGPGKEITFLGGGRSKLEDIDFRDPFVFYHDARSQYCMLVASRLADGPYWSRGCIVLLESKDLDTWTFAPEPLYSPNDLFCPECPELFTLPNGKWYLVYSRFHAPHAGTVYRVGDSPYGPFRVPRDGSHGRLDGRRWYAAKSCPKAGDTTRRIFFGWIGDYVEDEKKWLWGGDLGVPREVFADEKGYLQVTIVPDVKRLLEETSRPVATPSRLSMTSVGSTTATTMELGAAEVQDLLVRFKIEHYDAESFGLVIGTVGTSRSYRLHITSGGPDDIYTISLMTDLPPLDDFWADQYDLHLPRLVDGPELVRHDGVHLTTMITILLRGSLLEVFCGGRSISYRFPVPTTSLANTCLSDNGGDATLTGSPRLGWYVSDGEVELSDFSVRHGGTVDRTKAV